MCCKILTYVFYFVFLKEKKLISTFGESEESEGSGWRDFWLHHFKWGEKNKELRYWVFFITVVYRLIYILFCLLAKSKGDLFIENNSIVFSVVNGSYGVAMISVIITFKNLFFKKKSKQENANAIK